MSILCMHINILPALVLPLLARPTCMFTSGRGVRSLQSCFLRFLKKTSNRTQSRRDGIGSEFVDKWCVFAPNQCPEPPKGIAPGYTGYIHACLPCGIYVFSLLQHTFLPCPCGRAGVLSHCTWSTRNASPRNYGSTRRILTDPS